MSTPKHRRNFRPVKLLLVAAIVAIRLVVPAASKAQDVSWASQAHATPLTNVSANALSQGRTNGPMALGGFTSQSWPVVFELARGAKMVTVVGVGLDVTCTSATNSRSRTPGSSWTSPRTASFTRPSRSRRWGT